MSVQLGSIATDYSLNTFLVTVNDFINSHRDCLRARGSPVDEILANAADEEFFDNEANFCICTKLIYGETVEIGENNFETIYKFGDFFQIHEIYSEVKRWIDEELTCDNFWKVYIKLRSLDAKTSFFVNGICRHLSNDNDNFLACTKKLFKESSVETIAAAAELLLVPEVAHRDSNMQMLMELPMPYRGLETVIRATISIIKAKFPNDFDANLPEMDQLTKSQDTIKTFRKLAKDVIHPCVVAEIALKWGRSTDLRKKATAKGIIKALLVNLKESSAQWYNSVCNDVRYQRFIKDHLGLPLRKESYNPQLLDDNGITTLIECIIEGKGVESVRGFKYKDGKCPPYGDIADHWFIKTTFRHVSFIVDSKVDAIVAINASQCISLCRVPAPANPNTLQ